MQAVDVCVSAVCATQKDKGLGVFFTELSAEVFLYFSKGMGTRTGKVLEKKYVKLEKSW